MSGRKLWDAPWSRLGWMPDSQWARLESICLSDSRFLAENPKAVCRKSCLSRISEVTYLRQSKWVEVVELFWSGVQSCCSTALFGFGASSETSYQIFEGTFLPLETVVAQKEHQQYVAGAKGRDLVNPCRVCPRFPSLLSLISAFCWVPPSNPCPWRPWQF